MTTFMKPEIYFGQYFSIDTTHGTEIIPAEVIGWPASTGDIPLPASAFINYLEGTPFDPASEHSVRSSWLARLSAPGYLDCTDWTAHASEEAARAYLDEQYGE